MFNLLNKCHGIFPSVPKYKARCILRFKLWPTTKVVILDLYLEILSNDQFFVATHGILWEKLAVKVRSWWLCQVEPHLILWCREYKVFHYCHFTKEWKKTGSPVRSCRCINSVWSKIFNLSIFADLLEPCLLPTSLARETEPCARSISWSQQVFAPNSGYTYLWHSKWSSLGVSFMYKLICSSYCTYICL